SSRGRLTVRKVIAGQRRTVLHLSVQGFLAPESTHPAHPAHPERDEDEADSDAVEDGPDGWADSDIGPAESAHATGPHPARREPAYKARGPNGPIGPVAGTTSPPPRQEGCGEPPTSRVAGESRESLSRRAAASAARHGWPRVVFRPGIAV